MFLEGQIPSQKVVGSLGLEKKKKTSKPSKLKRLHHISTAESPFPSLQAKRPSEGRCRLDVWMFVFFIILEKENKN